MPNSPEKDPNPAPATDLNLNPNPEQPAGKPPPLPAAKKKRRASWSDPFFTHKGGPTEALKNAVLKMRLQSLSTSTSSTPPSESEPESDPFHNDPVTRSPDYTSSLSDSLLMRIFSKLSDSKQHLSNSLVCKRWCLLSGKLVSSVKLLDWEFLESGRLTFRFPNLVEIDTVPACVKTERNSGILLTNKLLSLRLNSCLLKNEGDFVTKHDVLTSGIVDRGVKILAEGCGNLRKVVLMNVSEEGLNFLAEECELLQEMELHCCSDMVLKGIEHFQNLQILKLVGRVEGVYDSVVSDIGMTIFAQGCRRLMRLELVGCEGSYDGIKAIGQCCQMLEELTILDHKMEGGWLSGLSYCENLKTLRIESCRSVDVDPGLDEHLGVCPMLEELCVRNCQVRDKQGLRALLLVCRNVRELVLEGCWGMDDGGFAAVCICRSVRLLSLEGCSLLTTHGLESVVLSLQELDRLRVVSCNNIKDSEITPELATLFSVLKELKWRPDSRSLLLAGLAGTDVGQKGGRSLRK